MDDFDWVINGIRPYHIESVDMTTFPKITLHCTANYTDIRYTAPIDEIKVFEAMACLDVTNETTNSGGTDLQTSIDGQIVPISNGNINWLGALYYPSYTPDSMADTLIKFDIIFELRLVNKDIIPDAPTDTSNIPYNLITTGYNYKVAGIGVATRYLGTFTFDWDGLGQVYIASDWLADIATDQIRIDDAITVTNNSNSEHIYQIYARVFHPGNSTYGPPLNITSILMEGSNELNIGISDVYGNYLGCDSLFMVQVDSE